MHSSELPLLLTGNGPLVRTVIDSLAPAVPLAPPEVQTLVDALGATAGRTIIAHVNEDGRCPVCKRGYPCEQVHLASHNFELLA